MIKLFGKLPQSVTVAVSGGVDSMVTLHFLKQCPKREVDVIHINHGTEHANGYEKFVKDYCEENDISCTIRHIDPVVPKNRSKEDYWRQERYKIFKSIGNSVVTAHHLDDCVETWLFTSFNGKPNTIPYSNGNVIRPFLLTTKKGMLEYADLKNVPFITDETNSDTRFARNRIRHNIMPEVLKVNPGIHKVVAKIINNS